MNIKRQSSPQGLIQKDRPSRGFFIEGDRPWVVRLYAAGGEMPGIPLSLSNLLMSIIVLAMSLLSDPMIRAETTSSPMTANVLAWKDLSSKEAIVSLFRMSVEQAHEVDTWAATDRTTVCQLFQDQWSKFEDRLVQLGPRSPLTYKAFSRGLTLYATSCQFSYQQFFAVVRKSMARQFFIPGQADNYSWFTTVVPTYATHAVFHGNSPPAGIEGEAFFLWLWPSLNQSFDYFCGDGPFAWPKELASDSALDDQGLRQLESCFAVSMMVGAHEDSQLVQTDFDGSQQLKTRLLSEPEPLYLPSVLFTWALSHDDFRAFFSHWFFQSLSASAQARYLRHNGAMIYKLFDKGSIKEGACSRQTDSFLTLFRSQTLTIDPEVVVLAIDVIKSACQGRQQQQVLAHLKDAVAQFVKINSTLEQVTDIDLRNLSGLLYQEDNHLQKLLSLYYHNGSLVDHRELARQPRFLERAIDSLILQALKRQEPSPWIKTIENTEDRDLRLARLQSMISGIPTSGSASGYRLIQLAYLAEYDYLEEGDTKLQLMVKIRRLATSITIADASFRQLSLDIHNNLSRHLLDQVYDFARTKDPLDPIWETLKPLEAALESYFEVHTGLSSGLQQQLSSMIGQLESQSVLKIDFTEALSRTCQELASVFDGTHDSPVDLKLATAKVYWHLLGSWEQNGVEAHQQPLYLEAVRIGARVHGLLGPLINLVDSQLTADYLASLFGEESQASFASSAAEVIKLVLAAHADVLQKRTQVFDWFLLLQEKRAGEIADYTNAIRRRRFALRYFHEMLIRESGLHFWDQKQIQDSFRILNKGRAVGRLVHVPEDQIDRYPFSPLEIVIVDRLPNNLGMVSGLITTVFQPLGSHIDLRTKEMSVPNIYQQDALTKWQGFLGKDVVLEVGDEVATVTLASADDLNEHKVQTAIVIPEIKTSDQLLVDLDQIQPMALVGAKAFGYSLLRQTFGPGSYIAKGLAIPFAAYLEHINQFGIEAVIDEFLALSKQMTPKQQEVALENLRERIEDIAKEPSFLNSQWLEQMSRGLKGLVDATIAEGHSDQWPIFAGCLRFRSSTNSEDLVGFTGAGLYESKTGCLAPELIGERKKSVGRAIAKVWASLWTYRAFAAREAYGIDHKRVAMAILVHRNFPDEQANGVMLSRSRLDPAFFVSVGRGENSITNPEGDPSLTSDEVYVQKTASRLHIIRARYSAPGQPLLKPEELETLISATERALDALRKAFDQSIALPVMKADIEFKWQVSDQGQQRLYLKQLRPFMGGML